MNTSASHTPPRITARVDLDTQALLSQAAAITGISSINTFVLSAAIEKAKKIMAQEYTLELSQRDAQMLTDALDSPTRSLPKLQQAAKQYHNNNQ